MFFIPGFIISLATFPGVIIHELGHFIFCKIRKVTVYDVKFFQLNWNTAGYVIHEEPEDFTSTLLISIGPLLINTILCLVVAAPVAVPFYLFGQRNLLIYFYLWLGVSIGMHAFPSNQDAENLWQRAKEEAKNKNILAIISMPLCVLIFIANLLKFFWFDAIYAFAVSILLPQFIVMHLM